MPDYGSDLSCGMDLDPMLVDVSGTTLMNQVCLHRVFCRPGSLLSNPVDNTIDLRDLVSEGISSADLPRIQGLCTGALLGDQRIFSATVTGGFDTSTSTLTLNMTGTGAQGPFNLTVAVSGVTVELLRP